MKPAAPKRRGRPRTVRSPQPELDEIEDMDDQPSTTGRPARPTMTVNVSLIQAELIRTRALERLGYVAGGDLTRSEALATRGGQKALVNAALDLIDPTERNWPDSAREAVRQWLRKPARSVMPTRERLMAGRISTETTGASET